MVVASSYIILWPKNDIRLFSHWNSYWSWKKSQTEQGVVNKKKSVLKSVEIIELDYDVDDGARCRWKIPTHLVWTELLFKTATPHKYISLSAEYKITTESECADAGRFFKKYWLTWAATGRKVALIDEPRLSEVPSCADCFCLTAANPNQGNQATIFFVDGQSRKFSHQFTAVCRNC